MNWNLHPARVRALLTSDTMEMDAPTGEWVETLNHLIDEGHRDGVIAFTYALENHFKDPADLNCDPDTFASEFERLYRQEWETAAAFAEHVAEDETSMGDEGEQQGRAWFLENYGRFINWQEFAESAEIVNTYSLIMLDPENSRIIHAFEMEA